MPINTTESGPLNEQPSSICIQTERTTVYLLFLVIGNQLINWNCIVLHLSSDVRVVFEGKHQCSNRPPVWAADQPGALVKDLSLNVVHKTRVLLFVRETALKLLHTAHCVTFIARSVAQKVLLDNKQTNKKNKRCCSCQLLSIYKCNQASIKFL